MEPQVLLKKVFLRLKIEALNNRLVTDLLLSFLNICLQEKMIVRLLIWLYVLLIKIDSFGINRDA